MPVLPFALIEDILCRLPVKSLKRFRCVAKSWCFLIDSENFIKLHLRQSLISNLNNHLILRGLGIYSIDLESLDEAHVVKPPFSYQTIDCVTNSCNGLVLVMSEPPVLWNPFSRQYKVLPDSLAKHPPDFDYNSEVGYGFAYDSITDDYKVLKGVEFRNKSTYGLMYAETEIYSLKSNSWKKIEGFPYPLDLSWGLLRAHVNGALHTLVPNPEDIYSYKIMAFSVESEKHYEVTPPPGARIRNIDLGLIVVGGCLCLICVYKSLVIIWMMKEYGVMESWSKLLYITPPAIKPHDVVRPLAYSRDGNKILLNCNNRKLVWYDLRKRTVNKVLDGFPFMVLAEVCVESLVSLDGPSEV